MWSPRWDFPIKWQRCLDRLPVDIIMLISFYLQDDSFSVFFPFLIKQRAAVSEDHAFKTPPLRRAAMIPDLLLLTASFAHTQRSALICSCFKTSPRRFASARKRSARATLQLNVPDESLSFSPWFEKALRLRNSKIWAKLKKHVSHVEVWFIGYKNEQMDRFIKTHTERHGRQRRLESTRKQEKPVA